MYARIGTIVIAVAWLVMAGCGVTPVEGGTAGVLLAGGQPLSDVQVTVHQGGAGAWKAIGFADTAGDGTFRLFANRASGPLVLTPGEYRFTLESVGAPIRIPALLTRAETTPLSASWTGDESSLVLNVSMNLTNR